MVSTKYATVYDKTANCFSAMDGSYEYDAFGKPYKGDLENGMSLGYTGKPYDAATGMYDYGYRDYKPENARFTTVDPVRDGSNWFAYVNNDPISYVDPDGLAPIYGDDIHGKPVVAYPGRDLKSETSIVIQRDSNPGYYNDTLSVNIGNQTILQTPVQSEADISEPRLSKEFGGRTLEPGEYNGVLWEKSGSYLTPIKIEDDAFLIHPYQYTNPSKIEERKDEGKSIGPWQTPQSAGCQIMGLNNFNAMTSTLQGLGFNYDGLDTINVTIKGGNCND
jgi:RHS repeat-associated protein